MVRSDAQTPGEYLDSLPGDRREHVAELRQIILDHLPAGFEEVMSYGMLGYVVPHTRYPDGYHCNRELPLPFMNLASQKNYLAVYHMGIYADQALMDWFTNAWAEQVPYRLDMGKSCIRLKKLDQVPFALFGELAGKMTPDDWIARYEAVVKR